MNTLQADPVLALLDLFTEMTQITRYSLAEQLRRKWGDTEETAILIDDLEVAWETLDTLQTKVGTTRAASIILCGFSQERLAYPLPPFDEGE